MSLLLFLSIIGACVFWLISIYNKLIRLVEAVNNNKKQIDIQLDRRFKVYESLIGVLKKYMDYEKTTLKEIISLRAQAKQAQEQNNELDRIKAENEISKIGTNLNVMFEQYPDLKADKNALQLQEEIVSTENKLTFAKQAYNDSIEQYVATSKSFLESIIVGIFPSKLLKQFNYWSLTDNVRQEHENYKLNFDG